MDVNEEFDEQAAERLLCGELAPDEAAPGYREVANLLAAARGGPSAAELSRQADTVRAMTAARVLLARGSALPQRAFPYGWRSGAV
jgi:hypothetical protein